MKLEIVRWIPWGEWETNPLIHETDNATGEHEKVLVDYIRTLKPEEYHGGFWHQNRDVEGVPLFNDGTFMTFSLRGWGRVMYDALGDGTDGMGYCEWAWEA